MSATTRTGSKNRKQSTITIKVRCVFCNGSIDDSKPAIECDNCSNWICLPCSKLSKTMYTELMKCNQDSDFAIDWSCRVCRSTKSDLKGISSTLQELKSTSEARLIRVEDRLSSLEKSMKDTVVEEVEKVRSSLSTTLSGNIAKQVNELVESRVKEIEDRKNRAQNIVIFKLALCESSDKLERKEYDMQVVKDLFSSICPD